MQEIQILANTIEALQKQVQQLIFEVQELKSELKNGCEFETMRPKDAMQILGMSRTTFDKYKKEGIIPCKNVGGKILVCAKTVHKLKKTGAFHD